MAALDQHSLAKPSHAVCENEHAQYSYSFAVIRYLLWLKFSVDQSAEWRSLHMCLHSKSLSDLIGFLKHGLNSFQAQKN